MNRIIELEGRKIEVTHKVSKRAKRVRLAIYPGGEMVLTTPHRLPDFFVQKFLRSKAKWIVQKWEHARKLPKPVKADTREEYLQHKAAALKFVKDRLEHFNRHYNFKYNKVTIKNHKSLWGSCSRRGNLNFNYKLALIPQEQADYVIVHELCHLRVFNHSQAFWDLVGQAVPNHRQIRAALRKHGLSLENAL
jgi:predicted metal-dependent hydrolase